MVSIQISGLRRFIIVINNLNLREIPKSEKKGENDYEKNKSSDSFYVAHFLHKYRINKTTCIRGI